MKKAKVHSIICLSLGTALVFMTLGCQQMAGTPGPSSNTVLSSGGADVANNASGSGAGDSGTKVATADTGQGGTIGASVGTENIGECPDPTKPCDQHTNSKPKTVGGICTQEYFRQICWGSDFRADIGLDQKTEAEQFDAISQGQIPDKVVNQASLRDVCVEHVDLQSLESYPKAWQHLCLFVRPTADSLLLGDVESPTSDDFRTDLAGSRFLAFVAHDDAVSNSDRGVIHAIGSVIPDPNAATPTKKPAEIKRPDKQ